MKKINPVVHFEVPADNKEELGAFYNKVFGWQTKQLGSDMGNYMLVTTAKMGEGHMPLIPGQINGGFYTKSEDKPAQYPSVVIAVENLEQSMQEVTKNGGKVLGQPWEIPGVGTYVSFFDIENNRLAMIQPLTPMTE